MIAERIGWTRSIRVLSGRVEELRPAYLPPDPASRTAYAAGEIAQCAGDPDPALAAVGLPCGDFPLQAGDQELLVGPGLRPGPLGEPGHGLAQGRGFQRPGQERDLGGLVLA